MAEHEPGMIVKQLARVRSGLGLSLEELSAELEARGCAVAPGTLAAIEAGLAFPRSSTLRTLARCLGLMASDLLQDTGEVEVHGPQPTRTSTAPQLRPDRLQHSALALLALSAAEHDAHLRKCAALAASLYEQEPELTAFEAFGEADLLDES